MSSKNTGFRIFAGLLLAALLASCAPASPTPAAAPAAAPAVPPAAAPLADNTATPAPTVDILPTLNSVRTQAVQTFVADLTRNAPTAAPAQPAATQAPPAPEALPTWTVVAPVSIPNFACSITSVKPTKVVAAGSTFTATWVFKNTGTHTWLSAETDVRFLRGSQFQTGGSIQDLANDVARGASYTVTVPMVAPDAAGVYKTTWILLTGSTYFCPLELTLLVN